MQETPTCAPHCLLSHFIKPYSGKLHQPTTIYKLRSWLTDWWWIDVCVFEIKLHWVTPFTRTGNGRHVVRRGVFFSTTVCKRMRSSLHSSAASLENYSKSIVKRCFLFSYLLSDLASLFEFSWFLCPVVLRMGIVPGRGCHDSQRHPFSAPLEGGILFVECSAKGLYFRQKMSTQHQLNASGLEQHHVTH